MPRSSRSPAGRASRSTRATRCSPTSCASASRAAAAAEPAEGHAHAARLALAIARSGAGTRLVEGGVRDACGRRCRGRRSRRSSTCSPTRASRGTGSRACASGPRCPCCSRASCIRMTRAGPSTPASTASWSPTTAAARSIAGRDARRAARVVERVAGRVPVVLDSGVRGGADAFIALALGATAVGIGRPVRLRPRGRRRDRGARGRAQPHRGARPHDGARRTSLDRRDRPRLPARRRHLVSVRTRATASFADTSGRYALPIATPIVGRARASG